MGSKPKTHMTLCRLPRPMSAAIAVAVASCVLGCSGDGTKTHRVRGRLEIAGGDVGLLAGSVLECMLTSNPLMRASGKIAPDGRFELETIHNGKVLPGALEGTYQARIILADEDDEGVPKNRGNPVHARYLEFRSSALSITVPTSGDITISLSKS
jgi:hypothetical protein